MQLYISTLPASTRFGDGIEEGSAGPSWSGRQGQQPAGVEDGSGTAGAQPLASLAQGMGAAPSDTRWLLAGMPSTCTLGPAALEGTGWRWLGGTDPQP